MPENERNIFIIGCENVGKTAIITQFKNGTFDKKYVPSVDDVYCMKFEYDGKMEDLVINDVSGKLDNTILRDSLMKKCEGFIVVFSITSAFSFMSLQKPVALLRAMKKDQKIPMILVGNKVDLEKEREVPGELAACFAELLYCPYVEISAKEKVQVDGVFKMLLESMNIPSPEKVKAVSESEIQGKGKKRCCVLL